MTQTSHHTVYHLRRVGLLGALLLTLFIVRYDAVVGAVSHSGNVLAYATEMSRSTLLAGTNAARAQNGLGNLSLDGSLNTAAQAKAEHMVANDYWAHVAPDGTQPWYFFGQAGYSYQRAGENLAYGFSTSQNTINGWMNSPGHRANILGEYADVGFGFVQAPNFVGSGPQTIVVAHYGLKPGASAASTPPQQAAGTQPSSNQPTAAPVTTAPSPRAVPATPATPTSPTTAPSTPVPTSPAPNKSTPPAAPADTSPRTTPSSANVAPTTATTTPAESAPQASTVSVLSSLYRNQLSLTALAGVVLLSLIAVGYALTHRIAMTHAVHAGEHFVATHPALDATVFAAVAAIALLTTYGRVG